ncbi:MAG: DUF116 domain-containing protein [Candidatus Goldbacteria bacterium]|nr:DUF116 domain-containing protein [Candidatus Goldiibacteriota bacterium]
MEQDEQKKDRILGDEWLGWSGDLLSYEKEINEGKRLFLLFYLITVVIVCFGIFFIYYLISPRLYEINIYLNYGVFLFILTFIIGLGLFSLLLILTVITNRNFIFFRKKAGLHLEWIYPVIYKIASIFKISKDRVSNSIIKVNNALIYITKEKFKAKNLLILLPRCFEKSIREKVLEMTRKYNCQIFIATGGSSARQIVKKVNPDAIIGVACERDLISGMADSIKSIPIIAIPNRRPYGPCKDTNIDIDELERAIKFLLKS